MPPDEPTEEERAEELPEDNETPFRPADDSRDDASEPDSARQIESSKLDDTHPVTDSGSDIQQHELYDEGVSGAVEASEPNAGDAVVNYTPPSQQDDNDEEDDDQQIDDQAMQPS